MKLIKNSLAILGATALLATTGHAVLVVEYQYNGTATTQTPDPTLDGATSDGTVGSNDNGSLASGVTYKAGNSTNTKIGAGSSSINFSGVAVGAGINFTNDSDAGDTTQDALKNIAGATLFTDFRLTSNITTGTPRFIFLSTGTSATSARAEIRINDLSGGQYTFSQADMPPIRTVSSP